MPTITRLMIKTAMGYLLTGIVLSSLWFVEAAYHIHPLLSAIQPTALHLIVVGWLTQLIFGVALWMFPPWSRSSPRGPEQLNRASYAALNAGLLLRLVAEPLNAYQPAPLFGWLLVIAAITQVVAVWIFIGLVWTRVRGKAGGH
jgi:hypothetical protein